MKPKRRKETKKKTNNKGMRFQNQKQFLMGIEGDVVSCLYEIVFDDNSLNKNIHWFGK